MTTATQTRIKVGAKVRSRGNLGAEGRDGVIERIDSRNGYAWIKNEGNATAHNIPMELVAECWSFEETKPVYVVD